jgi:hypothetical protein
MELDQVYGLDQTLINGKKYTWKAPSGSTGNHYLNAPYFLEGTVTIRGKNFTDVRLNYDVYNQILLLQYADEEGPGSMIEVSKAWLTAFSIGGMNFELLNLEQEPHFYQVLGNGTTRILYYFRKTLELNTAIGTYNYVFSKTIRDPFVLTDGKLRPFSTKRSLVKLFDPRVRPEIKSYLRKNRIKIKKASDSTMEDLINFIGKLK